MFRRRRGDGRDGRVSAERVVNVLSSGPRGPYILCCNPTVCISRGSDLPGESDAYALALNADGTQTIGPLAARTDLLGGGMYASGRCLPPVCSTLGTWHRRLDPAHLRRLVAPLRWVSAPARDGATPARAPDRRGHRAVGQAGLAVDQRRSDQLPGGRLERDLLRAVREQGRLPAGRLPRRGRAAAGPRAAEPTRRRLGAGGARDAARVRAGALQREPDAGRLLFVDTLSGGPRACARRAAARSARSTRVCRSSWTAPRRRAR